MFSFSVQVGRNIFTTGQTEMVYVYWVFLIRRERLEVEITSKSFLLLDVFWN